ncbi:hypothetical protein JCM10908_001120 [Rhodotorula pacifica]|uniref:uncharacterized protein n=1 Tax=Rhodotorula pacifica TaxID=1495444 RepID=UPI003181890D
MMLNTLARRSAATSLYASRPRAGPVSVAAWTISPARTLATQASTPLSSPAIPQAPPPPPDSKPQPKQRSATSEFYRALVPSMLHCLALGSIVYYALELAYIYLAREKEGESLRARVEQLEGELALERAGGTKGEGTGGAAADGAGRKSWWKLW